MNLSPHFRTSVAVVCLALSPAALLAQRPHGSPFSASAPAGSYNIANDVSLQGTVLSFTENSKTPPLGAHVLLRTGSGNVDVHLGDARLLRQAKLSLVQGMTVRFVGQQQIVGSSTVFMARLLQVGGQVVALRSEHGLPLIPAVRDGKASAANVSADQQGGAR